MIRCALAATLTAILAAFAAPAAFAQEPPTAVSTPPQVALRPFGVALGEKLPDGFFTKHGCARAAEGGHWNCTAAPTPTAGATSYGVLLDEAGRTVRVFAGWSFEDDPNCVAAAAQETMLLGLLTEKYGAPTATTRRTVPGEFCAMHLARRTTSPAFLAWDRDGAFIVLKTFGVNYNSLGLVLMYEHGALFKAYSAAKRAQTQEGL